MLALLSQSGSFSSFLESEGFTQIIDPTIFRKFVWRKDTRFLSVVLFYVDDILIWSQLKGEAERIFDMLAKKYKLKRTGFIEEGCEGEVTFLGRKIFRKGNGWKECRDVRTGACLLVVVL